MKQIWKANEVKEACTKWGGIGCDNDGHVVNVTVGGGSSGIILGGNITSEIGMLSSLLTLSISGSMVSHCMGGDVPESIGNLTALQSLTIANVDVAGVLPASIGRLSQLRSLTITGTLIRSPLPESLGDLAELQTLRLENGMFNETFPPWIARLHQMTTLSLWSCNFRGQIRPANLGQSLPRLTDVRLSLNFFEGGLASFCGLPRLEKLRVTQNSLDEEIPACLGQMPTLKSLHLSYNRLHGHLPSLEGLVAIESLRVMQNALTGPFPKEVLKLPRLKHLYLSNNLLEGPIPSPLDMPMLEEFHVPFNNFDGPLPAVTANMTRLKEYYFTFNNMSGTIPESLFELGLPSLVAINLMHNRLHGRLPLFVERLHKLVKLKLSGNQLSGTLPSQLGDLAYLEQLLLGGNDFEGIIPPGICELASMKMLDLSWNRGGGGGSGGAGGGGFNGSLPECFVNMPKLEMLLLGGNSFQGAIPSNWTPEAFPNLSEVDLSSNGLVGSAGHFLNGARGIKFLNLSNNGFSGALPTPWLNVTVSFDVSFNNFTDYFNLSALGSSPPPSFWSLTNLILSHNRLQGAVPLTLVGRLTNVVVLDISHNSLLDLEVPLGRPAKAAAIFPRVEVFVAHRTSVRNAEFMCAYLNPRVVARVFIGRMQIGHLPQCLYGFTALNELDASDNAISNRIYGLPPSPAILILSGCNITDLSLFPFAFVAGYRDFRCENQEIVPLQSASTTVNQLAVLELDRNNFTSLPMVPQAFTGMDAPPLVDLPLHGTVGHDCSKGFSPHVPQPSLFLLYRYVFSLNLAGNSLRSFPREFAQLEKLGVLDVHNNENFTFGSFVHRPSKKDDLDEFFLAPDPNFSFDLPGHSRVECMNLLLYGHTGTTVLFNASSYAYTYCSCGAGYFGAVPAGCRLCSDVVASSAGDAMAVFCPGNGSLTISDGFFPQAEPHGLWRSLDALRNASALGHSLRCRISGACRFRSNGCRYAQGTGQLTCARIDLDGCAEGYSGRQCTRCEPDFFISDSGGCARCHRRSPGDLVGLLALALAILVIFVVTRGFGLLAFLAEVTATLLLVALRLADGWILMVIVLVGCLYASLEGAGATDATVKTLLFFLQALAMLAPERLFALFGGLAHLSFVNFKSTGIECLDGFAGLHRPDKRLLFDLAVPMFALLLTVVLVTCSFFLQATPPVRRAVKFYNRTRARVFAALSPKTLIKRSVDNIVSGNLVNLEKLLEMDNPLEDDNERQQAESSSSSWEEENPDGDDFDFYLLDGVGSGGRSAGSVGVNSRRGGGGGGGRRSAVANKMLWAYLAELTRSCLFVLIATYFQLSGLVLKVFSPPSFGWMGPPFEFLQSPFLAGWNDPVPQNLLLLGSFGMVCFVFCIPLGLALILWAAHRAYFRRGDFETPARWIGFLYEGYRREVYFYELLWILRYMALAAALSILPVRSITQPVCVLLLLGQSLLVHLQVQPYASSIDNTLETVSLMALIFTYAVGQIMEPGSLQHVDDTGWGQLDFATVLIAIVNLLVIFSFLIAFSLNYWKLLLYWMTRLMGYTREEQKKFFI